MKRYNPKRVAPIGKSSMLLIGSLLSVLVLSACCMGWTISALLAPATSAANDSTVSALSEQLSGKAAQLEDGTARAIHAARMNCTPNLNATSPQTMGYVATAPERKPSREMKATRLGITIKDYDPNVDYSLKIREVTETLDACDEASKASVLALGEVLECQRNLKLIGMGRESEMTHAFALGEDENPRTIRHIVLGDPWYGPYTENDVVRLASVIHAEAGSSWISDKHQRDVGSVVVNRVFSPRFRNQDTIPEVIDHEGQYPGTRDKRFFTERERANAIYVLENGPTTTGIFQANFPQGTRTLAVYKYPESHRVTYICE